MGEDAVGEEINPPVWEENKDKLLLEMQKLVTFCLMYEDVISPNSIPEEITMTLKVMRKILDACLITSYPSKSSSSILPSPSSEEKP